MLGPFRVVIPKFIRRRYALKFAIGLLILGLAIGVAGFLGTGEIAAEVESQAFEEQSALADTEARNFERWHESNLLVTDSLTNHDVIQDGDPSSAYLSTQRDGFSGASHIHYIDDEAGEVVASSYTPLEGRSFDEIDAPWTELPTFDEMDPEEYREARFVGTHTSVVGEEVAVYVQPVEVSRVTAEGTADDFEGTIVYTVSLQSLGDGMLNDDGRIAYVVDQSSETVIVDPTGSSLFEGYGHANILDGASGSATIDRVSDSLEQSLVRDDAHGAADYHRQEYIASYAQIPGEENLYVVVHTPEEQAFGFAYTIQEYGTYLSIGGTLFIVLVGGIIARNTSRSLNHLENQAKRIGEGDLEVEFETKRIDSIGQLYDEFARMRDSLKRQILEAQEAREEAERARVETEKVNAELEAKADEYRRVMRSCAQGDLTARLDPETENESMREIGEEFNLMIGEIEETTANLKAFASEVATRSEQVTASSEEVRSASEQVTSSVQEISDGADRQNESLQSVTHEMNGLSTTTEEIAASSNEVADIAERTAKTGRSGREAAQQAIAGMNQIETESEAAVEEIERLEAEMGQIDELLTFITEIAEQTNMLALNANIEAARSGSSGEGFSVVASEVKELAEETKDAAEDIERRLDRIQTQTERTAEEVQATSQHVSENKASVESAVEALDEIAEYATETNNGVQEISAASQQQAASTQEVVAMVDEAATIAEQTSAESENVAAAAEEQTSSLTEVSQSANDLAGKAVQLSQALDRFDTDADVADLEDGADLEGESAILSEGGDLIDALQADDFGTDGESDEPLEGFTYEEEPMGDDSDDDEPLAVGPADESAASETEPADAFDASRPTESDDATDPLTALEDEFEARDEPLAVDPSDESETVESEPADTVAAGPADQHDEDEEPFAVGPADTDGAESTIESEEAADPLAALGDEPDDDSDGADEAIAVDPVDESEEPVDSLEFDSTDDADDLFDAEPADDVEADGDDSSEHGDESAQEADGDDSSEHGDESAQEADGDDSSEHGDDVFSFGDSR
ncbi:methyl-accepting chemotaxis protein [Natronobeatus ordinarius]|uniref:methyl-accepting chemotaxis protein n=1 Tax=Natronobeatus ordinarius TaxID=2963433 RepID=UPI0020CCCC0B|nr:methyl-accepting chemotaxis protein [Natronobeatus ordinarius]